MTSRVPLRLVWPAHVVALILVAIYVAMAVVEPGLFRVGTIALTAAGIALWGALVWVTLPPRESITAQFPLTIRGSRFLAALLLVAWFLALAGTTVWGLVLWQEPDAVPSIGFTVVMILGGLGSLPTLLSLLRGRLHLWQLDLDALRLRYAGGRRVVEWPWTDVSEVTLNSAGTQILLTRVDGGGSSSIPTLPFQIHAPDLVAAIDAARATATRR